MYPFSEAPLKGLRNISLVELKSASKQPSHNLSYQSEDKCVRNGDDYEDLAAARDKSFWGFDLFRFSIFLSFQFLDGF